MWKRGSLVTLVQCCQIVQAAGKSSSFHIGLFLLHFFCSVSLSESTGAEGQKFLTETFSIFYRLNFPMSWKQTSLRFCFACSCSWLPREAVDDVSLLAVFKDRLDGMLSNLIQWKVFCP